MRKFVVKFLFIIVFLFGISILFSRTTTHYAYAADTCNRGTGICYYGSDSNAYGGGGGISIGCQLKDISHYKNTSINKDFYYTTNFGCSVARNDLPSCNSMTANDYHKANWYFSSTNQNGCRATPLNFNNPNTLCCVPVAASNCSCAKDGQKGGAYTCTKEGISDVKGVCSSTEYCYKGAPRTDSAPWPCSTTAPGTVVNEPTGVAKDGSCANGEACADPLTCQDVCFGTKKACEPDGFNPGTCGTSGGNGGSGGGGTPVPVQTSSGLGSKSSVTIPSGLSCVGGDERPFTSSAYQAQGGVQNNLHPNPDKASEGTPDNLKWSHLTVPNGGCIKTWCDSGNVYANFEWNPGYNAGNSWDSFALRLWMSDTQMGTFDEPGHTASQPKPNQTILFGAQSAFAGKAVVADVGNGYDERGFPFTYFKLSDCSATTQPTVGPTTQPIPSGPPAPATASIKIRLDSFDLIDAPQDFNSNPRQPHHLTRNVKIYLYKTTNFVNDLDGNNAYRVIPGTVSWTAPDPNDPNFKSTVGLYVNPNQSLGVVNPDSYYVFIRTEASLMQPLTTPPTLTPVFTNTTNVFDFLKPLHMGKLTGTDNSIGALDFNIIQNCYGATTTKPASADCLALPNITDNVFTNIPVADLNDDGKVDGIDYNIFIRNFEVHGF